MKKINLLSFITVLLFIAGCAHGPIETTKRFLGVSTQDLENARDKGVFWVYYANVDDCFDASIKAVRDMGGLVYMRNKPKKMIVAMDFEYERRSVSEDEKIIKPLDEIIDTTEIGIFFESVDQDKTKVVLSSLSSSLLADIADNFFNALKDNLNVK